MKQNVYDQKEFYEKYRELRQNLHNHNELIEQPALKSLLPDLKGLDVLDLGCGNGVNSQRLIELGANSVLGIDISKKMLAEAKKLETEHLKFMELAMEDISSLSQKFNLVVSSLAFHYVKDLAQLLKDINQLLTGDGYLVFSQEHPLNTCFDDKHQSRWTRDSEGKKMHANIAEYSISGERRTIWFNTEIVKYHRSFSEIINGLTEANFTIECMKDPFGLENEFKDNIHRPDFLMVRTRKLST